MADLQERLDSARLQERLNRARGGPAQQTSLAEAPSLLERGAAAVQSGAQAVKSFVTGEGQFDEELPELGPTFAKRIAAGKLNDRDSTRLASVINAARVPSSIPGRVQKIKEVEPSAQFDTDDFGNVIVQLGSERFFLNRPGASQADITEGVTEVGTDALFAVPLGAGGRAAAGLFGEAVGTGAGIGVGNLARDVTAGVSPDVTNAAIMGATGAAFQAFAPVAGRLFRRILGRGSNQFVKGDQLTDKGKAVVRRAGIDPDTVTPDFIRRFRATAGQADDTVAAARVAEAQSLPSQVPLSRGDVTRNVREQAFEDAALRGAQGEPAQLQAQQFRDVQQEAIRANIPAIRERLGGEAVEEVGQGIARVQANVGEQARTARATVDRLYKRARELNTSVLAKGVDNLAKVVDESFDESFSGGIAPRAATLVKDLTNFRKTFRGDITAPQIKRLENWRQRVSALERSNDSVESAAAKRLRRTYDAFMERGIDDALIRGDEGALEAFKAARSSRVLVRKRFESDKIVASIIEEVDGNFKLPPSEAVSKIFTVNSLGGKAGSVGALRQIKELVGEESAEWAAMKQEGFLRLLASQEQGGARGKDLQRLFSGDKFATAFDNAMNKSPELMRELFTRAELALMQSLKRTVLLATNRVPGAVSLSNTPIIDRVLDQFGFLGREARDLAKSTFGGFLRTRQESAVRRATTQPLQPRIQSLPPGAVGVGGVAATDQ